MTREEFQKLKELPFFKGKVVSASMEPVIMTGDYIAVDIGQMDLKRFDIIVIYVDGKLICHYVWFVNKLVKPVLIQTRNMGKQFDHPVALEDYFGKVISHRLNFWHKMRILF